MNFQIFSPCLLLSCADYIGIALVALITVIFFHQVGKVAHDIEVFKRNVERTIETYSRDIDTNHFHDDRFVRDLDAIFTCFLQCQKEVVPPFPPDPIDIELENENKWLAEFDKHVRETSSGTK